MNQRTWKPSDLAEVIFFYIDTFGINRCFFGGDWPVCTLTTTLADWIAALKEIIKDKPFDQQVKLFHGNAVQIYKVAAM